MKITKEQAQELYNTGNPVTQTLVKDNWAGFFELEDGKWHIHKLSANTMVFKTGETEGYGFYKGTWENSYNDYSFVSNPKNWRLAEPSEVESALIAEAKKKGFKSGVSVKGLDFNGEHDDFKTVLNEEEGFSMENGILFHSGDVCNPFIYKDGQWATILPQPKEMTLSEIEAKLGYSVKIVNQTES